MKRMRTIILTVLLCLSSGICRADEFLNEVKNYVSIAGMQFGISKSSFGEATINVTINHLQEDASSDAKTFALLEKEAYELYGKYANKQFDIDASGYVSEYLRNEVTLADLKAANKILKNDTIRKVYEKCFAEPIDTVVSHLIDVFIPAYACIRQSKPTIPITAPIECGIRFQTAFSDFYERAELRHVLDLFMESLRPNDYNEAKLKRYINDNMMMILLNYYCHHITLEDLYVINNVISEPTFRKVMEAYVEAMSDVKLMSSSMTDRYIVWLKNH